MVVTRLERDIQTSSPCIGAGLAKGDYLGVRSTKLGVKSLANFSAAAAHDNGTDHGIRRNSVPSSGGEFERTPHPTAV
jgi:hypothetical protein